MCQNNQIKIEITQRIKVDKCIAEEIKWLNSQGVRTEGSCCGHGKSYSQALIKPSSVNKAKELGYNPIYLDNVGLWEIKLKGENNVSRRKRWFN
jgi:hypothetical protein